MGLCLVAVFAMTAFAASSASALPEVIRCVPKEGTGKYKDANCTLKAGKLITEKKFEISKEYPSPEIKGLAGASSLETESGTKIECTASTAKGQWDADLSGTKPLPIKEQENVVSNFTNCSLGVAKKSCQSGVTSGEIVTNELEGPIGYINKLKKEVGAELKPHAKKGLVTTFECEGFGTIKVGEGTGKLGDCIIARVTSPVNVMTTSGEELYTGIKGTEGQEQQPQHFEGKTSHCNLETKLGEGGWERTVQRQTETLTFAEAGEIKA